MQKRKSKPLSWVHTGRDVGSHPFPIPDSDAFVVTNCEIKASDGTILRGDLYLPQGQPPFPAIVEITPYGAQRLAQLGRIYSLRGYLFLAVDCRGRYRSQGKWEPLTYDQKDGHSVINWLGQHELCNGKVGSRGHSYCGYNQLLAAIDAPSYLKAMCVGVAPGDPFTNTPYQGGCYDLNDLFWLLDMSGRVNHDEDPTDDDNLTELDADINEDVNFDDDDEDSEEEIEHDRLLDDALKARPFQSLDIRLGIYHEDFQEWIKHWQFDDYWLARSVLAHIEKIAVPALHISGWWDGNGRGATQFYEALRTKAKTIEAREQQKLLMGAYNHDLKAPDCDDLPDEEAEKIERAALRDSLNDELAWFDHQLMGLPQGYSTRSRVTLFVTGIYRWIHFEDWPIPYAEYIYLYAQSSGKDPILLPSEPTTEAKYEYIFNPLDPTPFGHEDVDAERMPFDNSKLQKTRKDLCLFTTEELSKDLLTIGPVTAYIFANSDTLDFDIIVSLYDVYPDGRSIFLTDGALRARFLEGYAHPKPYEQGEVKRFVIDLWHLGHVFRKGHRIRLQIASASYLRFDINPCTGGNYQSEIQTSKAKITIHCSKNYPTSILIPSLPSLFLNGE